MTLNLNQTQKTFLKWLVEIVREKNFNEDNLIFLFTTSWTKLLDGRIEEIIPEEMNLQRTTLDALIKQSYLTGKEDDGDYVCSLTQKAYQAVDSDFISSSEESKKVVNYHNNFQNAQIGNVANELNDNAQQTASNFTQSNNPQASELLQIITELRQIIASLPTDIQQEIAPNLEYVSAEVQKPEEKREFHRLRQTLTKVGSSIIQGATLINNAGNIAKALPLLTTLAQSLGIHLQLPPGL